MKAMSKLLEQLNQKPAVRYHDGGLLFAGDETCYPEGWYLFLPGIGTFEVDVPEGLEE